MSKRWLQIVIIIVSLGIAIAAVQTHAETADELQQKINSHGATIKELEDEIAKYQAQLNQTSAQAKSLQSTLQTLELNAKKLDADMQITENKIDQTNLTIQQLSLQISDKQGRIGASQEILNKTVRQLHQSDSVDLLQIFLSYSDPGTFWEDIENVETIASNTKAHIVELRNLKEDLVSNKDATEKKKKELVGLQQKLNEQKTAIELNKQEKNRLLTETKNQESSYKKIIADKQARKKAFEAELNQYESQLKLIIDPKSIPSAKTGVLAWPLTPHRITQYFGNTEFAQSHTAVYSGNGHNGIDIAAPIGTPISAALSGTVQGTGDTDTACPGASYGKWVLVKHDNGLSTLYAHFSQIAVSAGQTVSTGNVLGYSGMTGYATGPHLHFTVYASQGVQIISRPSKSCGGAVYTLPVADLKAYLDPIGYLPDSV
jgi:murein DD-endopeptidase MepM/ murein hydrolase activator NlpD